jgi:hypothetical protein
LVGNYRNQDLPTTLDSVVLPQNISEASISHDGKSIVWVTREDKRCYLVLTDLISMFSCHIRVKTGDICCPAWSPDNKKDRLLLWKHWIITTKGFLIMYYRYPNDRSKNMGRLQVV